MSGTDPSSTRSDFRNKLRSALSSADSSAKLDALAQLARAHLGFVETIQIDQALAHRVPPEVDGYAPMRIAVLSNTTIDHLLPAIRVAGLSRSLRVEAYAGAYGQHRQELLDPASHLLRFRPDIVLFSLTARDVISGLPLAATVEEVDHRLSQSIDELRELWRDARRSLGSLVIQQSYLDVYPPLFGSFDRLVPAAPSRAIARLNEMLAQAAVEERVLLLDIAQASGRDGIDAWFDVGRWLQGKMEVAPQAARRYAELLVRLIDAQRGKSRKCLVLDLDNTLWGGEIGDVGLEGIVLGEGSATGEAYLALQHYARRLKERGIALAVCSKNEMAAAEAAFRDHPEMVLRRADIAAFVVNWNDKAENLRSIAEQLNIGLDALVFVDDNPVERARIRESLPMVAVPELPSDPALFVRCLADAGCFEAVSFTEDDRLRSTQYANNAEREALRCRSQSMEDFLRGLEMHVRHGPIHPVDVARATQLINKTNQFNTTTRRYSEDELRQFAASAECLTLQFRLADRFGDNGLVSVMILRPAADKSETLVIESWVMSCRVFGRQLEYEAMNIAVETVRDRGVKRLLADYFPTERNKVIAGLYERLGFSELTEGPVEGGTERWVLNTSSYLPTHTFIKRSP